MNPKLTFSLCKLQSRSIFKIDGFNSLNFLQRLVTNDVSILDSRDAGVVYTGVLNSRGRILYDLFIHKMNNLLMVDCSRHSVQSIISMLEKYKMREQISFGILEECEAYQLFSSDENLSSAPPTLNHEGHSLSDPRLNSLGVRVIVAKRSETRPFSHFSYNVCDESVYKRLRYSLGICEGEEIIEGKAIPHEYNLDCLNALSFSKGCYLGQELVARTEHLGEVRKRICSFKIMNCCPNMWDDALPGSVIFTIGEDGEGNIKVGEIVCKNEDMGCALVRLKYLEAGNPLFIQNKGNTKRIEVKVIRSKWWKDK